MKLECPFCRQAAMPAWRKLALGLSSHVKCWNCGLRVTVAPSQAVLALLPSLILVAWVVMFQPRDAELMITLGVLAFLTTCIVQLLFVPLIRNQIDPAPFLREAERLNKEAAAKQESRDPS